MENDLKKTADKMAKIKGNAKGDTLVLHVSHIRNKEGEKGLKKVEEKMKEIGYPVEFDKINKFEWYPVFMADLLIIVPKEIFNWTDEDIFKMGYDAPKYSFILRLLLQHTLSIEKLFEATSYFWKKYFDFGELEPVEIKKKHVILRMKGYEVHPIVCKQYYRGYFSRMIQLCLKNKEIETEETKCFFDGDPYHEYLIKWK